MIVQEAGLERGPDSVRVENNFDFRYAGHPYGRRHTRFTADRLVAGRTLASAVAPPPPFVRPWPCERAEDDRWCPIMCARLSKRTGPGGINASRRRPACNERERAARALRVSSAPSRPPPSIGSTWTESSLPGLPTNRTTRDPRGIGLEVTQNIFDSGRTSKQRTPGGDAGSCCAPAPRIHVQQTRFRGAEIYIERRCATRRFLNLQRNNVRGSGRTAAAIAGPFRGRRGHPALRCRAGRNSRLASARSQVSSGGGQSARQYRALSPDHRRRTPRISGPGGRRTRLVPGDLDSALSIGLSENPGIFRIPLRARCRAAAGTRARERNSCQRVGVRGSVSHRYDGQRRGDRSTSAIPLWPMTVPLY